MYFETDFDTSIGATLQRISFDFVNEKTVHVSSHKSRGMRVRLVFFLYIDLV